MNRYLLVLIWLALYSPFHCIALTVEGLYVAEVAVPDQSAQSRKAGIAAALRSVMVKLTGDRNIFGRSAAIDIVKDADRYVQQYEFRNKQVNSPEQVTPEKALHLWVNFNAKALNNSLRNYAIPIWGQERPSTLMWVAIQDNQHRKLISQEDSAGFTYKLNRRAAHRGVPLVYPLLDLEDTLVIKASDVWEGNNEAVLQASRRYGTDAILTVSLEQVQDNLLEARWSVSIDNQAMSWTSSGDNTDIIIDEGIDGLADILAQRFAPVGGSTHAASLEILVEGIIDYEQYVKVSDYLASLNTVTDVRVKIAEKTRILFEVVAQGGEIAVAQSIELGNVLESTTDSGGIYRLLP